MLLHLHKLYSQNARKSAIVSTAICFVDIFLHIDVDFYYYYYFFMSVCLRKCEYESLFVDFVYIYI